VRSIEDVRAVGSLVAAGLNDCEIARRTGIPRPTVRDWRRTRRWDWWLTRTSGSCPRCGAAQHPFDTFPPEYAYLLGMYLGDGHVVKWRKGVYRLTVAMDSAYPWIISECSHAIRALIPGATPYIQPQKNSRCVWAVKYSKQWPCLFPQHGPGPKHRRPIVLRSWQEELVKRSPELSFGD
jgi:hypothetical protein